MDFISNTRDFLFSVAQFILFVDLGIIILAFIIFILNDKTKLIKIRNAGEVAKKCVYIILGVFVIAIIFGALGLFVDIFTPNN